MDGFWKTVGINLYNYLKNGFAWRNDICADLRGHNILIDGIRIDNRGRNNRMIVEDGSRIKDIKITFVGNNNEIYIGKNCRLGNTIIRMEDDSNKVLIKSETSIGGGTAFYFRRNRNKDRAGLYVL